MSKQWSDNWNAPLQLERALRGLFGAVKNEMALKGLPLEWNKDSAMGVAERVLREFAKEADDGKPRQ